jgi:hypothetical protein
LSVGFIAPSCVAIEFKHPFTPVCFIYIHQFIVETISKRHRRDIFVENPPKKIFQLRQERYLLNIPPLTGLCHFAGDVLQRCRAYGAICGSQIRAPKIRLAFSFAALRLCVKIFAHVC